MRVFSSFSVGLLIAALSVPVSARAAVEDLPGMDTAANLKEWLKLTDDQVAKVKPVIARRLQRMDAAFAKAEAEEQPDVLALVEELGNARKEFDGGVQSLLTPDQLKQWRTFQAELEKDLVKSAAKKQVRALQPGLALTDDQVQKLVPPFTVATQKKVDAFQKLSDGTRITLRDKIQAKKTFEAINEELQKAMAAVVSPAQLSAYQQAMQKK